MVLGCGSLLGSLSVFYGSYYKCVLQVMEENHHRSLEETLLLYSISYSNCKSESFLQLVVCNLGLFHIQIEDPVSGFIMIVNLMGYKITTEMNP